MNSGKQPETVNYQKGKEEDGMTHKAQNGSGKSKVKVNRVDDYAVSDAPSLSTSRLWQQLSSYDEDEIISYAHTRRPTNNIL